MGPLDSNVWRCLSEILRHFVTFKKTWFYGYTSETNEQSKQCQFLGVPAPKESDDWPERWRVPFLGLKRFALYRPPIEPHKDHQTLLYWIIELIRHRNAEKTVPYGEEKSALRLCLGIGSHICHCNCQIGRIRLQTADLFTIFSRFGASWISQKSEEIWLELWECYVRKYIFQTCEISWSIAL